MKKLNQGKGRRVHPAPPAADAGAAVALALPAAVLALVAALTAEEQEVLAYLLSGGGGAAGGGRRRRRGPHAPEMGCGCFGCYKSFWARWDASPNRHLIHRIIDAVEEDGGGGGGAGTPRRHHRRRRRGRGGRGHGAAVDDAADADASVDHHGCAFDDGVEDGDYEGDEEEEEAADSIYGDEGEELMMDGSDCTNGGAGAGSTEKSTVGRLVRFIGEKVWGAWT